MGQTTEGDLADEGAGGRSTEENVMTTHKVLVAVMMLLALVLGTYAGERAGTNERADEGKPIADGVELTKLYSTDLGLSGVYRFVDREAEVICWIFISSYKGGISCLPLDETGLDQ